MKSDSLLIAEIADLRTRLAASEAEVETLRMKIAACSTAAFQNTQTLRKDRIEPGHPYYSAAYGDICRTVDREIAHREALAESGRKREEAERALARAVGMVDALMAGALPHYCGGERDKRVEVSVMLGVWLDLRGLLPPAKKSQEGADGTN